MKLHNVKAVAQFLDLSERRVRQLRDENVIQEVRPGLYDLMETNRRYINFLRDKNPDSEARVDYNTERALLMRAKRKNEEFDLAVKENELHRSEDLETVLSNMLINFRSRMMAIPAALSPILAKKTDKTEIFKLIKEKVEDALNELSDFKGLFGEGEHAENEASDD